MAEVDDARLDPGDARLARRAARGAARRSTSPACSTPPTSTWRNALGALAGETDEDVLLAVALAVRAPRLAHVCVDLASVRDDGDDRARRGRRPRARLPWPDAGRTGCRGSPPARSSPTPGDGATTPRPLRLEGNAPLPRPLLAPGVQHRRRARRSASDRDAVDRRRRARARPRPSCSAPTSTTSSARAASAAVRSAFSVVAGGPGTGKTTTVARIVVLLDEQAAAAGRPLPRVALAAPTGKAAARLEEAVHSEARNLARRTADVGAPAARHCRRRRSTGCSAGGPGTHSRFRHDRSNRLPYDVVIVDETSMVSTSMMANLVDGVGADARLILVGDPDQLASVEAGAVLGDIVGPAADAERRAGELADRRRHRRAAPRPPLRRRHRRARHRHPPRRRRRDARRAARRRGRRRVDRDGRSAAAPAPRRSSGPSATASSTPAGASPTAARAGDAAAALDALRAMRVLCAHRRGPSGVAGWTAQIERWLAESIDGYADDGPWYVGRPLLVTTNDHALRLYNGDTGVVVRTPTHGVVAAFERGGSIVEISPRRIAAVDTVHAMTIHKSQGSQFDAVAVVLPEPTSPILTRELLYTAVTRAQRHLIVVGERRERARGGRPPDRPGDGAARPALAPSRGVSHGSASAST